jgi:hypothetical protein
LVSSRTAAVTAPVAAGRASIRSPAEITTLSPRARFIDDDGPAELETPIQREGVLQPFLRDLDEREPPGPDDLHSRHRTVWGEEVS